jgi:hypothetical protein
MLRFRKGTEVEVRDSLWDKWTRATYVTTNSKSEVERYVVRIGESPETQAFMYCRKFTDQ